MAIIRPNTRNAFGVPARYSDLASAGLRWTPPQPETGYTYEAWDVTGNSAQLYETNIDLADYQYNEDGLELHVIPDGYIAVSGGFSSLDRFGIKTDTTLWRILPGGGESLLSGLQGWNTVAGDNIGFATTISGYAYRIDSQGLTGLGGSFDHISGRHGGGYVALGVGGGYLYRMDDISTPIDGPGYTDVSGMLYLYPPFNGGFAIKNGRLMGVKANEAGVATADPLDYYLTGGWTAVTGYQEVEETGYQTWVSRDGYGVRNGALHRISSWKIDSSNDFAPIIAAYVHRAWMVSPNSAVVIRKVPTE